VNQSSSDSASTLLGVSHSRAIRLTAVSALLLLLCAFAFISIRLALHKHDKTLRVQIGKPLPGLIVSDKKGTAINLANEGSGHRRVIAFYSPDCHVCQLTLPELDPFPENIMLVLVSERDTSTIPAGELQSIPSNILFDRNKVLSSAIAISSLPTILFVREDGVVQDATLGAHSKASIQDKLSALATVRK